VNMPSINTLGLLPSRSLTSAQIVWLHNMSRVEWAIEHVSLRHGVGIMEVCTFTVYVPRSWVKQRQSGLFVVTCKIPPERIHGSPAWINQVIAEYGMPGLLHPW
jgi:hypothetical protein